MVEIKFLGACKEVGRSAVLIKSEETNDAILCDYGIQVDGEDLFPEYVNGKDLSAIVLTHSHIDHSGAIPSFYISGSIPLYCTKLTFKVSEVLYYDMLRLNKGYIPFDKRELHRMKKFTNFLKYGSRRKVGENSWITLFNAGHIPGSAMVLIEMDGKNILYTGDINTTETQLVNPADPSGLPKLDAVICETTYGTKDHHPRKETEDSLIKFVNKIVENDGIVLIPAFAVSRSQEMLMVLNRDGKNFQRLTMDGMARKIAVIYKKYPNMFKDYSSFKESMNQTHFIDQRQRYFERRYAATNSGVIVAPSGMLKGGTARYYSEHVLSSEKNAIFLVSYQIENSPGFVLLDKGSYVNNDGTKEKEVQAQVKHFDFSSHCGKSDLIEFLQNINFSGEKNVFCIHGDAETIANFAQNIKNLGFNSNIPDKKSIFKV